VLEEWYNHLIKVNGHPKLDICALQSRRVVTVWHFPYGIIVLITAKISISFASFNFKYSSYLITLKSVWLPIFKPSAKIIFVNISEYPVTFSRKYRCIQINSHTYNYLALYLVMVERNVAAYEDSLCIVFNQTALVTYVRSRHVGTNCTLHVIS